MSLRCFPAVDSTSTRSPWGRLNARDLPHDDRGQRGGATLEQVTKQLNKLINVIKIVELEPESTVERELIMVKVRADLETRSHVLETVNLFRAKVVDVAPDTVTIEATGNRGKLDALLKVLEQFGIKELVGSGMVAVGRGSRSISDRSLRSAG